MTFFRLITSIIFFVFLSINVLFAKTFENIKITGNKRVSLNSIIVLGDIDINGDYTDRELSQIIKKLYDTDFFESIIINISNDLMIINVVENPIIEDLKITGVKNEKLLKYLEDSIQLKNRKSFSEFNARRDLVKLKNISKSLGYYFAEINYNFVKNEKQNTIQLTYDLNLGSKTKIKKIIFLGNTNIKDKALKELIVSEEHKFWKFLSQNVYLNPEQIALDKRLLLNYYKDNGYYN